MQPETKLVPVTKDNVRVGLRVKRGPDWRWGAEGSGVGVVTSTLQDFWAWVRWTCGKVGLYRFGLNDCHDLAVADEPTTITVEPTTITVKELGARIAEAFSLPVTITTPITTKIREPVAVLVTLTPAATRALQFLSGLNLQHHPVAEQREALGVIRDLMNALRAGSGNK